MAVEGVEVVGGGVACTGALFEGDFFRLKSFIVGAGTASSWRVCRTYYIVLAAGGAGAVAERCRCGCVVRSSTKSGRGGPLEGGGWRRERADAGGR